ncbi:unnamed protein product, partial [Phaeothamnion confervicola]
RETIDRLRQLGAAMERREARNAPLFCEVPRALARTCGREMDVLQLCIGLLEHARRLAPDAATCLRELGDLEALAGNYAAAAGAYQRAARADETDPAALHGVLYCQIHEGQLDEAQQQLEFFTAIHNDATPAPRLAFLRALLDWRR